MGTLREEYEKRKAGVVKVVPAPAFTLKDYVSIGLSVLALGTTLLFNVFLKTDDIRGIYQGAIPKFNIEGDRLYAKTDASLALTNIGNRVATIVGVYLMVSPRDSDVVPESPCYGGAYYYTYFDLDPVVMKAGEAAVIHLKTPDRFPILFDAIKGPKQQILVCLGFSVFSPTALINSKPIPLMMTEIGEGASMLKSKRLDHDMPPFIVYRNRTISW